VREDRELFVWEDRKICLPIAPVSFGAANGSTGAAYPSVEYGSRILGDNEVQIAFSVGDVTVNPDFWREGTTDSLPLDNPLSRFPAQSSRNRAICHWTFRGHLEIGRLPGV
jgi:hypothetical protein